MALKSEVETLQQRLQEHTEFLESIRNAPEDEGLSIVRKQRSTENAAAVLSPYQGRAGGSSQISEHASARAVMPSTESGVEFELVMFYPTAYPILIPPSPSSIVSASLIGGSTQTTSSSSTPLSPSEPYAYCDPHLEYLTAERSTDSTTTLAALNCLSVATGWNGRNELGNHQLVTDARTLATRMHLLDAPPTDAAIVQFQHLNEDEIPDQAHVAWGSYGWQSFRASFFAKPSIKYLPNLLIAGDDIDIFATLDTFGPAHSPPDSVGHTFTAMSKFGSLYKKSWLSTTCRTTHLWSKG
ncbi:hypothetical protein BU25DRAFT_458514 [Macroventuria anomochaeta]|uniref:Uncharacterized protein n=1 Tax=Macroventuria anomochaeta TaxID=301207 RepID=A0ACB6S102_9PLEO|nr:uncharacterized protein BU25DRAFT_458514 [Macroventuria anomochaeta]KAF2627628.1 hypothetical protein BU25DRAFT_458514 [Macroventuria anomochaeta]